MGPLELKNAVITYLNGDVSSSGYEPLYAKRRLEEKYGNRYDEIRDAVNAFFDSFPEPEWQSQSYENYLKQIEDFALKKQDWMTPALAKAISSYFGYQWR